MDYFLIGVIVVLVLIIWILLGFFISISSCIYGGQRSQETLLDMFIALPFKVVYSIFQGVRK